MSINTCKLCGSLLAINDSLHGRVPGLDLDLCDACYWRKKYDMLDKKCADIYDIIEEGSVDHWLNLVATLKKILNILSIDYVKGVGYIHGAGYTGMKPMGDKK